MRRTKTSEEIQKGFENQRAALIDSCASFDAGKRWEAIRLATSVFVLVHDGGKQNRSLLTQMGVRGTMTYLASGHEVRLNNLMSSNPLAIMRMSGGNAAFIPRMGELSQFHRWVSFGEWWERDAIFSTGSGKGLVYRKGLVFNLRDKDGGAHFDVDAGDTDYQAMVAGGRWVFQRSGQAPQSMVDLELVSMRQVAHELLESLKRQGLHS